MTSYPDLAGNQGQYVASSGNQFSPVYQSPMQPSTALARRSQNHALISTPPRTTYDPSSSDLLLNYNNENALVETAHGLPVPDHEDIDALEAKAKQVKKELKSKQKDAPPFVIKLWG